MFIFIILKLVDDDDDDYHQEEISHFYQKLKINTHWTLTHIHTQTIRMVVDFLQQAKKKLDRPLSLLNDDLLCCRLLLLIFIFLFSIQSKEKRTFAHFFSLLNVSFYLLLLKWKVSLDPIGVHA